MASTDPATLNGSSGANAGNTKLSAAQRLERKHDESHKPTIEDVPDEEDLTPHPHPASSSILEATDEPAAAPSWAAPMSAKAAGKRKEGSSNKANAAVLDTQSDESFPGLGGSKVPVRTAPSPWVSKTSPQVTNGARNGISTNGTSTPAPATNTPPPMASQRAPKVAAPSSEKKNPEEEKKNELYEKSYTFDPKELPRSATKKPLPDLLRDINKKYRLNFTQNTGAGGAIKITVASTKRYESVIQQALRELGSYINKVCTTVLLFKNVASNTWSDVSESVDSSSGESPAHRQGGLEYQIFAGEVRCSNPNA